MNEDQNKKAPLRRILLPKLPLSRIKPSFRDAQETFHLTADFIRKSFDWRSSEDPYEGQTAQSAWAALVQEMTDQHEGRSAADSALHQQYAQRRFQAWLALALIGGGTGWLIAGAGLDSLGGLAVTATGLAHYLPNVYHLFQIRNKALVTFQEYLRQATLDDWLPSALPEGWQL